MNLSAAPQRFLRQRTLYFVYFGLLPLLCAVQPPGLAAESSAPHASMDSMSMSAESHQHAMSDMDMSAMNMSFAAIPMSREASGTAWQPDDTPMYGHPFMAGDWSLMAHYNVFAGYDHQSGPRGDDQFNSINWLMLMATKSTAKDQVTLRTMLSLEPWTTTSRGYPLLFQSGESYRGRALVDRQHPHDFFMELAARYRHAFSERNVGFIYVAPAGEPALGPAAFPHRLSAMDNPAAPISHHWIDSTHISFGVLTAGLVRDKWQLEGSWFNGREPDEHRWNIEDPKLDSYSARLTWNPTPAWSAQISHGYLKSPEALHPREHVWRTTASVMNLQKLGDESSIATTLAWGLNDTADDRSHALSLESTWATGSWNFFGRAEYVQKAGEELDLQPEDRQWDIGQVSLGASRELVQQKSWQLALGGSVTYTVKPKSLDPLYGDNPIGYWIFLRLRPAAMGH